MERKSLWRACAGSSSRVVRVCHPRRTNRPAQPPPPPPRAHLLALGLLFRLLLLERRLDLVPVLARGPRRRQRPRTRHGNRSSSSSSPPALARCCSVTTPTSSHSSSNRSSGGRHRGSSSSSSSRCKGSRSQCSRSCRDARLLPGCPCTQRQCTRLSRQSGSMPGSLASSTADKQPTFKTRPHESRGCVLGQAHLHFRRKDPQHWRCGLDPVEAGIPGSRRGRRRRPESHSTRTWQTGPNQAQIRIHWAASQTHQGASLLLTPSRHQKLLHATGMREVEHRSCQNARTPALVPTSLDPEDDCDVCCSLIPLKARPAAIGGDAWRGGRMWDRAPR